MQALNDLVIRGSPGILPDFLRRLGDTPAAGWRRAGEFEQRLRDMGVGGDGILCFRRDATADMPSAAVWLQARGPDEWYVSNVVPIGRPRLSKDEYNGILGEFDTRMLKPLADKGGIKSEISPPRFRLEEYLSPKGIETLRAFSATTARPSDVASLHPIDREKWQAFILQAHREDADLVGSLLEEWLGSEGWPETTRRQLRRDYEDARQLLWAYEKEVRR